MTPTGDLALAGWLLLLTLATFTASALAWRRAAVKDPDDDPKRTPPIQWALQAAVLVGVAIALGWRWAGHEGAWRPISAHLDGLLLLSLAAAASILFVQFRAGLHGAAAFALPLLGLVLTWSICAAAWTYEPFNPDSHNKAWLTLHLTTIYLGALGALLAAGAGLAYLQANQRLKSGKALARVPVFGSLESLERLVVIGSAVGFCLLTVGLASGVAVAAEASGDYGWWREPKAALGFAVWLGYGVVMNARATARLRGAPAAVTAVVGFAVLIAAYAAAEAWPLSLSEPTPPAKEAGP